MYHLFVAVSLMMAQDYLQKEVVQKPDQKKVSEVKQDIPVNTDLASSDSALPVVEQNTKADFATNDDPLLNEKSQDDILETLKEKEKEREEKIKELAKQDLESLSKTEQNSDFASAESLKTDDLEKTNQGKETDFSTLNNEKKPEVKKDKIEQKPVEPKKEEKKIDDTIESPKLEVPNAVKVESVPAVTSENKKDEIPQKNLPETSSQPEAANIIPPNTENKIEESKSIDGSEVETKIENKEEKKDKKLSKEEEKKAKEEEIAKEEKAAQLAQKKRDKAEALRKERDQKKKDKLMKLRQDYLDTFAESLNVTSDQSFIIPPRKVMPKFINEPLPPQLIEKPKSYENRHHPDLVTRDENVRFMFQAIAKNKIDDFRALFRVIPDPDLRNSFGDTLLIFSLLMQKYDAVAYLLANGANPNLKNRLGYTPLNVAIELSDYVLVELLVGAGADINYSDSSGVNYLMQAVRVGYFPIVDFLVEKGVDVNIVDKEGFSALDIAYRNKQEILTKYLRKKGAQTWIKKDYIKEKSLMEELQNRWSQ